MNPTAVAISVTVLSVSLRSAVLLSSRYCVTYVLGDCTMFGPNVTVATAGHPILPELREQGYQYNAPVHIGKNCWIGAGVIILPGITIGDNVVVGAGSIVTKDLPSNVVAVGNPCKVMREVNEHDKEYYFKDKKIPQDL